MSGKIIKSGAKVKELVQKGVNTLANTVGVTLGPRGRNVAMRQSWGTPHITKDGITVARNISFKDQFEDMGAQLVRAAAQKTVDEAGDGTTTATILAQAIYNKGLYLLAAGYNPMDLKKGIDKAIKIIVDYLDKMTKPIQNQEEIEQIGSISANDPEIGALIAEAVSKVGKEGVITIDESPTFETHLDISEGMYFDRGYITPWFITNVEKSQADLNNCFVLIHEDRLEDVKSLVPLFEEVAKQGRPLLIIAEDFGQNFLATLIFNKRNGSFFSCPVKSPGFGERRKEILRDLAVLTGATLFAKELGNDVAKCEIEDLGQATKIVVNRTGTTIIGGAGKKEDIIARINQIRDDIKHVDNDYDKKRMQERLAKLAGGVAIIRVGAPTEPEMKEKKDRVEDAMHATRAAVEEGIVPGGGVALLRCIPILKEFSDSLLNHGEKAGVEVIMTALQAPIRLIVQNAGGMPDVVVAAIMSEDNVDFGYNAATDIYENLVESGVIDPKKVVRSAIQNAASVASMLLTTEAMIADDPSDVEKTKE
ncbi:MAG: chaperonin GroEL [Patescibacteria group bacterium]